MNKKACSIFRLFILTLFCSIVGLSAGKIDGKKYANSIKHLEELKVNEETERLDLYGQEWVCYETLIAAKTLGPNLKDINICGCKGIDAEKIINFAKDYKCDVSYGNGPGDTWFTAKADGRHPTIHQVFRSGDITWTSNLKFPPKDDD